MKKLLNILGLLMAVLAGAAQTEVEILFHNADTQTFTVGEAGKIYFDNGHMLIDEGDGIPYSFPLSDIRKMMFNHAVPAQAIEASDLRIYPNPATTFLHIGGDSARDIPYQLFAMDGRMVMSGISHSGDRIAVGNLPQGLYLLKIDGRTFKISKL